LSDRTSEEKKIVRKKGFCIWSDQNKTNRDQSTNLGDQKQTKKQSQFNTLVFIFLTNLTTPYWNGNFQCIRSSQILVKYIKLSSLVVPFETRTIWSLQKIGPFNSLAH
jgi:hypothetical protein